MNKIIFVLLMTLALTSEISFGAQKKISDLDAIANSQIATSDLITVVDIDGTIKAKKMTFSELDLRWLASPFSTATSTTGILFDNEAYAEFQESTASGDNYVRIKALATLGGDYTLTLPPDDGTSGQKLTTDGSGVLTWETVVAGFSGGDFFDEYTAKTANYTVLDTDYVLMGDSSGGAFTFTLPSGSSGQRIVIKKTDTSFNIVNVGAIADLNTQGESVTMIYTGAAWIVESRYVPSGWTAYTPVTNWSSAASTNTGMWKRIGDSIVIRHYLVLNGAPTGNYSLDLPSGLTIDTTKAMGNYTYLANVHGNVSFNAGSQYGGNLSGSDSNTFSCRYMTSPGSSNPVSYSNCSPTAPTTFANGHIVFAVSHPTPIDGWEN